MDWIITFMIGDSERGRALAFPFFCLKIIAGTLERKTPMKKRYVIPILLLGFVLLAGCAGRESGGDTWRGVQAGMEDLSELTERTEYYDIVSESVDIFHLGMGDKNRGNALKQEGSAKFPLGTQFYQGEPIQLWAEAHPETSDICLYRTDGSRELLLEGVPTAYTFLDYSIYSWYMAQEGDFYCWHWANYSSSYPVDDEEKEEAALAKISSSGEIVYEKELDPGVSIEDFCQLPDGRCYLLLGNGTEQTRTLAELDPATGNFSEADRMQMKSYLAGEQRLGTADGSLAAINYDHIGRKIVKLNPADGTETILLSFTGTSYAPEYAMAQMKDFRVSEDGSVEIIWQAYNTEPEGTLERLRMAKVDKIPIVMRGNFKSDGWITKAVSGFNRQSGDYHVIIEDCGIENDVEDFARLTSIQLAAGKGPDIIQAGFMQDYIAGMLEKGLMEELSPYMEKSGVKEEDYFPAVFGIWRDGGLIYGVNPRLTITGYRMDESVLGGREEPDIETLVDSLLSWEGKGVFLERIDSGRLLKVFLEGTDTLWGMVDWEKGTCDFSGGLFPKLLEAAGRYGDDGRKGQVSGIAEHRIFYDIFQFDSLAEQESGGKVTCGILFDDGCCGAVYSARTLAVNSNSHNKEGAWEFLRFLLGDEVQSPDDMLPPVDRRNFELWLEKQRARVADGKEVTETWIINDKTSYKVTYTEDDLTEEKLEEYRRALEGAKPYPIRTASILDIILEEAEDYFNGSKSAEQVSEVVANRVQLYLDEIAAVWAER